MDHNSRSVLTVTDLHKKFKKNHVLNGLNLEVARNEIHGLVGLNGAGKTTTIECISGLKSFSSGSVRVMDIHPSNLHSAGGRFAVVFDTPCIHPNLTVHEAMEYALLTCGSKEPVSINELEEKLGIALYRKYKIKNLSLGNRRRTSIAQALIGRPEFIILDEPFSSLDAGGVDDLIELIRELNKNSGTTFLLASHQLPYLEKICTNISILHKGLISLSVSINELFGMENTKAVINTDKKERTLEVLSGIPGISLNNNNHSEGITVELSGITTAQLNRELISHDINVYELIRKRPSLDSVFRKITGGTAHV